MIGCQNELTSSTGRTDSGSWLQYWCWSSLNSTFSQITLTSFSFYNYVGLNTSTSTCTNNRTEYHANTIRSSLLMWMTWLPDFSLLSLDSNILQCFLPHRTSLCLPCLRSPPTKRAVNRNPTDEDNRNVYREGHSLYRNGNKMPSLRGKHTTTDQFSKEEAAWPES